MKKWIVRFASLLVFDIAVLLTGVHVSGWFWGYALLPVILLIGWAVYDLIDDRVEAQASSLYDKATGGSSR